MATPMTSTAKTAPKAIIKIIADGARVEGDLFKLKLEARVTKGTKVLSGVELRLREGINTLENKITNTNGEADFEITKPLSFAGKEVTLRMVMNGLEVAEDEFKVTFPTVEKVEKDDPQVITMRSHHDGNGVFTLFIRVYKEGGVGISVPVVLEYNSSKTSVKTDSNGTKKWQMLRTLAPGETLDVVASVSGIADSVKLCLRRRNDPALAPNLWTRAWFKAHNNQIAACLLIIMALFWITCPLIGFGNSVFMERKEGLSQQQTLYNQIVIKADKISADSNKAIADKGNWQKNVWIFTIILTIFTAIYAPLSLREEVAEGLREGLHRIATKNSDKAGDPLYERLASFAGTYAASKQHGVLLSANNSEGGEVPLNHSQHTPFHKLLASDIISDTLVEVIPSIISSVFRR